MLLSFVSTQVLAEMPHAIWVSDWENGVIKLSSDGAYLGENPDILRPNSVAVDSKGRVWVASLNDQTLHQLNPDTFDEIFTMRGFGAVKKILIDPLDDELIVLDQGRGNIVKLTPDGAELFKTRVRLPLDIALDPTDGSIWVAGRDVLYKLDQTGKILLELKGLVSNPLSIVADPITGTVWVADTWHSEVFRISPEGQLIGKTPVRYPTQLALNIPFGGVAILDQLNRKIHFMDENGNIFKTLSEYLDNPRAIAIDPQTGHLWVATDTNDRATIKHLSADGGVLLNNIAGFFIPNAIAFDFSNKALVSDVLFSETREIAYPRIPSRLSVPRYEPVTVTEDKSGGDKGLHRSALRNYMKSSVHLPLFKSYDLRAINYRTRSLRSENIYNILDSYCQELLVSPYRFAPYQESVRTNVIAAECNVRNAAFSSLTGFPWYGEPLINVRTLSAIPTVGEIHAQSMSPQKSP